jgi:palmitoyltransferase ZDHHC4
MLSMTFIFLWGTYLTAFAFFTYICMIADPDQSRLAHLIAYQLPDQLALKFSKLVGPKYYNYFSTVSDYALVIFYVLVVGGSWAIIFGLVYPWIDESLYVSNYHKYIGIVVFASCVLSWRVASSKSPGIITENNIDTFDNYPYDNIMYVEGRICPTVGIRKLARSKFDRFSGVHIARFDHFCGWLHNPIGEENYRWFLLFLVIHIGMCVYGFIICGYLFLGEIEKNQLWDVTFISAGTNSEFKADYWVIFQYLYHKQQMVGSVFVLMGAMIITLGSFFGYHVWIASRGMTTNETVKWSDVKEWHKKETKRYKAAVKAGVVTVSMASTPLVSDGDVSCIGGEAMIQEKARESEEPQIMDPGPMPKNIYNLGIVENWKEILFPRSLRATAIERYKVSLSSKPVSREDALNSVSMKPKLS